MEVNEYVTLNWPERTLFTDVENSCHLILRECKTILDHDTTYHDSLKKSHNRKEIKRDCNDLLHHFSVLSEEVEKIIEFKKTLEVKS